MDMFSYGGYELPPADQTAKEDAEPEQEPESKDEPAKDDAKAGPPAQLTPEPVHPPVALPPPALGPAMGPPQRKLNHKPLRNYAPKHIDDLMDHGVNPLDLFPIPGSPEFTLRANLVIGGPLGFFLLKLSQLHHPLYNQYDVTDDTVNDYVPVDDDDDETKRKKEAQKAEERKRQAEQKQKTDDKRRKSEGGPGFMLKLFGTPKPLVTEDGKTVYKAHLGGNSMYWLEEHKKWLDKSRPVEEQLAEATPPPPPMAKKPAGLPQQAAPLAPAPAKAPAPAPAKSKPAEAPAPRLAAAAAAAADGLDELLGPGPTPGTRPKKKGKTRRAYVSVMDK